MRNRQIPLGLRILLFVLFFCGYALNVLLAVGPERVGLDLRPGPAPRSDEPRSEQDALRESVLFVAVERCDGEGNHTGTAFVVAAGEAVTAAHVVAESIACGKEIRLLDHRERQVSADLEGYSDADDLALLRIDERGLPPLPLADSTRYQDAEEVVPVLTVGYPLPGAASTPDKAAVSGVGNLSQYREEDDRFVTSGLNLNTGNSGGPVLLEETLQVLGVASAKLDGSVAEGIGYVIPAATLKRFYRDKTGRVLP